MCSRNLYLLTLFLTITIFAVAQQNSKRLPATRTTAAIQINGNLDEAAWKTAPAADQFVEQRPSPGRIEEQGSRTEVYILYDDVAVYVGGYCHERSRDSITTELVGRDIIGANDYVGIMFDTYLDKINAVGFYVTPLSEQYDARYYPSEEGEDGSWNAVYISKSQIHADGWSFEMRIPYSALRFSKSNQQEWGMNITRNRRKAGRQGFWNEFNPKINGLVNQFGVLTDLKDIRPPLRLSLTPYLSAYANHYPYNDPATRNWNNSVNGGMDLKLGISQSFTLDMTLIPDFGQVQSDNKVLNLTPFEVKFDENRSFFTEGTELFSKGNLFYSRRIGSAPLHYYDVEESLPSDHQLRKNPSESKLINATKISGRTRKGLGIGLLNAMSQEMFATIEDGSKQTYKLRTAPFTNYNILVLDQSLKNNSSVSLVNTSVIRDGADYDATVTAGVWNINDKKNQYNTNGKIAYSRKTSGGKENEEGFAYNLSLGKTGGKFTYQLFQEMASDRYDQNDMGILFNNNYLQSGVIAGYRWLEPNRWRNRMNFNINGYVTMRYKPWDYQQARIESNLDGQLKNLWTVGFWLCYDPKANDYYEPRVAGKTYHNPASKAIGYWVNTNEAKRYSLEIENYWRAYGQFNGIGMDLELSQLYRFNDKLSVRYSLSYQPRFNHAGFTAIDTVSNTIIFAQRDRQTLENILVLKYNFNNRMGLNTRVRHYWSKVSNKNFFSLLDSGDLEPNSSYGNNPGQNYNFFNVDMVYTWQFAPGSFINLVWKNSINTDDQLQEDYIHNIRNVVQAPAQNSLSLKIIYYLDVIDLRHRRH